MIAVAIDGPAGAGKKFGSAQRCKSWDIFTRIRARCTVRWGFICRSMEWILPVLKILQR